jgi:tRNA-modifying protein YgfZ
MPISLPSPQLIQITGTDAIAFAQAQFSSDVRALPNGHWQWSAWLSAQGRVRAFFHLLRINDTDLRLILRGAAAVHIRDALARYVFRAKVQLRVVDDQSIYMLEQSLDNDEITSSATGSHVVVDASSMSIALPGDSPRWLLLRDASARALSADDSDTALNASALQDIDAGLVALMPALEDRLLPDWIGLTDLAATSVGKGCYPGQEIVARLHFKGGNKRWLHHLTFDAVELPAAGASIDASDAGGESRGMILNAAWISPRVGAALGVLTDNGSDAAAPLAGNGFTLRARKRIHPRPPI